MLRWSYLATSFVPICPPCWPIPLAVAAEATLKFMVVHALSPSCVHMTMLIASIVCSGVKVTKEVLAAANKLKVVGRAGVGVDNIDVGSATQRGVVVMNTPGGNTSAAAELTLTLLMSMARQIPQACADLKKGAWERKKYSGGTELRGKTIGVIGLGMIGTEVARRCKALDMIPVGFDPLADAQAAAEAGVTLCKTLDEVFARSDFITVHTPLNGATKNLISAPSLAKCKDGVFILNVARGGIVNEVDLLAALHSKKVAGAALDVYESEPPPAASKALLEHPAVICTPHLGASTEEAQKKVAEDIARQMCDAFLNKSYVGCVNAPHLSLAGKASLQPYVRLAEALGSLKAQTLAPPAVTAGGYVPPVPAKGLTVRVDVEGPELSAPGTADLLKAAALKGFLPALPSLDLDAADVNLVNALFLAEQAGITVQVKHSPKTSGVAGPYPNIVRVTITPGASTSGKSTGPGAFLGERAAAGSVLEGKPKVVQVDAWQNFPSFAPSGSILMFNNIDRPGQVSRVTSELALANVNIATLNVARQFGGGGSPALSLLMCDQRIPGEVASRIASIDGITGVRTATFQPGLATAASGSGVAGAEAGKAGAASPAASA